MLKCLRVSSPILERAPGAATIEEVEEAEGTPEEVVGELPDATGAVLGIAEEVMDEVPEVPTEGIAGHQRMR